MNTTALSTRTKTAVARTAFRSELGWLERWLLAAALFEIPIGIDKFFFYSVADADYGAVAGFNLSFATICFVGLYALWAIAIMNRELAPNVNKLVVGIPLLVYMSTVALSVLAAEKPTLALCDLFLLVQAYAMFFYIANRISKAKDLVFCVNCLAAALLTQGIFMILQRAIGASLYGQRRFVGPISFTVWDDGRTAGSLVSAVGAGSWMAILWLVVLSLFLTVSRQKHWRFLALSLLIGLVGIMFTQTRGAIISVFLGTLVVGGCMLARGWLPRWTLKLAAVGLLVALLPILQVVQKRVIDSDAGSAESRVHLSSIAFQTIAKNPIFGYGAGNCHLACLPVANESEFRSEWYYTIHCKYLLVWIETGIFGLVAFVLVLLNGLRYGFVAWQQKRRNLSPLGLGCSAAIAGHMVHMIVDIFNARPQVQTLWIVLGVSAAVYSFSLREIAKNPKNN